MTDYTRALQVEPDFVLAYINRGLALLELKRRGQWREFWKLAVRSRRTIGACGATGSGKTDFIKRLLQERRDQLETMPLPEVDQRDVEWSVHSQVGEDAELGEG